VTPNNLGQPWLSFGHYLQAVHEAENRLRGGLPIDERLASGFNEGVGNEGAFLVTTDTAGPVIEQIFETGAIASRCRPFPISANANGVKIPAYADKTRTDGNRSGGVTAYWAAEAALYQATTPKPFERVELELHKLTALCYATEELLNDAAALNAWIGWALPDELAFKLDDSLIRGAGAGVPLGILNATALVSQTKQTAQTAATIVAENLVKMYSRMPARLLGRAVWFINSECWPQVQMMTSAATSASQMIYMPPGGLSQTPYGTILGRPVIPIEHCEALGTKGDILFCDFNQYALARKGGVQMQTSIHVRFLYDETAFKFSLRVDGKPLWNTYITPYKGSATQSPFVALDTRSA
jgi:HK97 family phage major capsid protein